jgi:triphosphatase
MDARRFAPVEPPDTRPAPVVKASPVKLPRKVTVLSGARIIISGCLEQIVGNQEGVLQATNPESIHQMRVGVRRLRSAMALFSKWIEVPAPLRVDLKGLAILLGPARDADVLASDTLACIVTACPNEPSLQALVQAASADADAKRRQVAQVLHSDRYAVLIGSLRTWLSDLRLKEMPKGKMRRVLAERLDFHADRILVRCHRRLIERGAGLDRFTVEERHQLRIAAKKLRYAVEFFQSLHAARRSKRYLRALTALQGALGELNDAAVADQLLRELGERQRALAAGAAFARGFLCAAAKWRTEELGELWCSFRATDR